MAAESILPAGPTTTAAAGRYVTFYLGHESYGVPVLKVREIIRILEITPVPNTPRFIKGVANLRGKVIPVIDLRIRFALGDAAINERTCIVVMQVTLPSGNENQMGFIVDAVAEVVALNAGDIEPRPDFGAALDTRFIMGMAKVNKTVVTTLLDIDKVVDAETVARVATLAPMA